MKPTHLISRRRQRRSGALLLELIIALSIFSIAVVGLSKALENTMAAGNIVAKENTMRHALRSFLEEQRRKPLSDMATQLQDPVLEATFTSTVEPLELRLKQGGNIPDLHKLTATVTYTSGPDQREESVFVWVHLSEAEQRRRRNQ